LDPQKLKRVPSSQKIASTITDWNDIKIFFEISDTTLNISGQTYKENSFPEIKMSLKKLFFCNQQESVAPYEKLFTKRDECYFLKEPNFNSAPAKKALPQLPTKNAPQLPPKTTDPKSTEPKTTDPKKEYFDPLGALELNDNKDVKKERPPVPEKKKPPPLPEKKEGKVDLQAPLVPEKTNLPAPLVPEKTELLTSPTAEKKELPNPLVPEKNDLQAPLVPEKTNLPTPLVPEKTEPLTSPTAEKKNFQILSFQIQMTQIKKKRNLLLLCLQKKERSRRISGKIPQKCCLQNRN